ncbi:sigma-70 family RNA polymerase sigma factor [Kitasatospora sp. NPDC058218]|uniref:sigma-70 family RNA polymerase sigma factor n=1 Tax=Kitasatospora sp. NPDC058218 TaxID=3346385 RepID=UPI0036DCC78B
MRHDTAVSEYPPAEAGRPPGAGADTDPGEELIRALHRDHAAPLLRFVLHLVGGDRRRAESVVQATLLRAWQNIHRLDHREGSLRPWLVSTARRIAVDERSGSPAQPRGGGGAVELLPTAEDLDTALRLMAMSDAMEALGDAHREVLAETYLKGRTVNEAAVVLGVPPATVRSRVYYALRSLRIALDERGVAL